MTCKGLRDALGIHYVRTPEYWWTGKRIPTVGHFLRLAEIFGWCVVDDINYVWYHRKLYTYRLNQRISMLGATCRDIDRELGRFKGFTNNVIHYLHESSPSTLWEVLHWIETEEVEYRKIVMKIGRGKVIQELGDAKKTYTL